MQDSIKNIEARIEKNRMDTKATRLQANTERNKANTYVGDGNLSQRNSHQQQAIALDQRADQMEAEANALEPQRAQILARITELKAEREAINREALNRTTAIDNELIQLQGSMTI